MVPLFYVFLCFMCWVLCGSFVLCVAQCWEGYFENVIGYRLQVTLL